MTKGQLLALDRPQQIKEQFGEGYKLLIEPKTDVISMEQFAKMKPEIDSVIFQGGHTITNMKESQDSTSKKLIYQIPFKEI